MVSGGAWKGVLDQYGGALLLLARQWGSAPADAEDIVQDAFIRYWRRRGKVRDPAAYLFAAVRSAALDQRRRAALRGRIQRAASTPEEMIESQTLDADCRTAMEKAIAGLAAEQREVLVMKIWGGLTFAAIGAVLGIPAATAASRYRYALVALRGQLDPSWRYE